MEHSAKMMRNALEDIPVLKDAKPDVWKYHHWIIMSIASLFLNIIIL